MSFAVAKAFFPLEKDFSFRVGKKLFLLEKDFSFRVGKKLFLFKTVSKYKGLMKSTKKPDKWKKHSVSIIVLATLFGRNLSSSDFSSSLSYLSRKKGTSETFLSLSLFISRPRPTASASKIRLRLRKTFPQFPFFYFGNLEKLKSDEDKFFLRVASTIIETKY